MIYARNANPSASNWPDWYAARDGINITRDLLFRDGRDYRRDGADYGSRDEITALVDRANAPV